MISPIAEESVRWPLVLADPPNNKLVVIPYLRLAQRKQLAGASESPTNQAHSEEVAGSGASTLAALAQHKQVGLYELPANQTKQRKAEGKKRKRVVASEEVTVKSEPASTAEAPRDEYARIRAATLEAEPEV